jgi:initiation factor 1A
MGKNKGGGRNHKKQANKNAPTAGRSVRLAVDSAEIYAKVTKICGNGRAEVRCKDGVTRILEIRKKFRGRHKRDNMLSIDTVVLAGVREWEVRTAKNKEKLDLLYVYSPEQHDTLLKDDDARLIITGSRDKIIDSGFHIGETDTWKQKVEDEEIAAKVQSEAEGTDMSAKSVDNDDDFDLKWDDI